MTDNFTGAVIADGMQPVRTFDAACKLVIGYLTAAAPMGMWAVTRVDDDRQLMLMVASTQYPVHTGDVLPFRTSFCRDMVSGDAPQIAPDIAVVPEYANAAEAAGGRGLLVGAYVGVPIVRTDGALFGTVCGYSRTAETLALQNLQPLLAVLSGLLSAVLGADLAATSSARDAEQAHFDADIDVLTGLLNRRGWNRFLEQEENRFRRFGDPASVIIIDLDRLKDINDESGHPAGDRHLQLTAAVLRQVTRDADVVARLGGDEFGVLAVGTNLEQATTLVRRTEQALERAGVAGSVGAACYSIVAGFPGALKAADDAMYHRKRQRRRTGGTYRVEAFPPDGSPPP